MSIEEPSGRLDLPETRTVISLTKEQLHGGRKWIREHKDTRVSDTPLWVLISLGIQEIEEQNEEDSTKCQANMKSTIKESCGHGQKQSISVPPVKHKTPEPSKAECIVKPVRQDTEATIIKTRKERVMEIKEKIYELLIAIGFILVVGTVGAIDIDSISLTQGIFQLLASFVAVTIGVFGLNFGENRRVK